jgi:hypothetical protein
MPSRRSVNVVMLNLAYLVVGVVVVEVVFGYNALGQYLVDHVTKRDLPVVQAVGLIFAAVYIGLNMAGRHHRHPGQPAPEAPEMRIPLSALIGLTLTGHVPVRRDLRAMDRALCHRRQLGGVNGKAMSAGHWLGTDTIGRDILSRLIYGAQITIFVALASSILSFSLGAFLGLSGRRARAAGSTGSVAARRSGDGDPVADRGAGRAVGAAPEPDVLILVMGVLDSTRVFRLSRAVAVDIA